jgi:hypothetical protein
VTIVDPLDDALAHQLLATPPDEFVAARNALVKQLKASGDREQAAEIGAMRRPAWVDWALNVAATQHGSEVERFAESAELMRAAQRGAVTGRGGVDMRAAMTGLRDRTGELARAVNSVLTDQGRPPALPEITERLAEVATSDAATEQLRAGLLSGGDGALGFGDIDTTEQPAKPVRRVSGSRRVPDSKRSPAPADPDSSLERRRIERDLKTAERVSHAARRDADRADTAVRHAKTAVDAATDTVNQAQSALDRARRRLDHDEADRDAARQKAEAAAAEVTRLRKALDAVG